MSLWGQLKALIKRQFNLVAVFAPQRPRQFKTLLLEELPEQLDKHTFYILGEGKYVWSANLICPCGCGEIIQLNLHKDSRPRWNLIRYSDGTVSLRPSIHRTVGCQSHFFFERGQIRWCNQNEA